MRYGLRKGLILWGFFNAMIYYVIILLVPLIDRNNEIFLEKCF